MELSPNLFDPIAGAFDARLGLPEEFCRNIADAVVSIAQAEPGDLIVEVGPGTGQIGQWFDRPIRYVGFDLSAAMLKEFCRRLNDPGNKLLIQADGNAGWPIRDRAARIIFSSRAVHLLEPEHVASEVFRVAHARGATLIVGRVDRDPASVRSRMAAEMLERLRKHGFQGRRGKQYNRRLFELCCSEGADSLETVTVARWKVMISPSQSLDAWRQLKGLGGVPVPRNVRDEILSELELWAEEVFGGLSNEFESDESYTLRSVRVTPVHSD
ncbi:MAG: class I SAM-dependent methyltransferase [Blastocatellia bacterium]